MSTGNLSIDGTSMSSILLALGTVDKGNTLAKVPLGLSGTVNALELDDGGLGGLEVLTTLVTEVTGLDVKTKGEGGLDMGDGLGGMKLPDLVLGRHS